MYEQTGISKRILLSKKNELTTGTHEMDESLMSGEIRVHTLTPFILNARKGKLINIDRSAITWGLTGGITNVKRRCLVAQLVKHLTSAQVMISGLISDEMGHVQDGMTVDSQGSF